MKVSEFFGTVDWRATGIVMLLRLVAGSLVLALLISIFGEGTSGPSAFLGLFAVAIPMGAGALALGGVATGLARAGVPFIGLLAIFAWFWVGGDPLVWGLKKVKPEVVPVDKFSPVNRPVLFVFKEPQAAAEFGAH